MNELTADRLRELLHYDPETGQMTWRVARQNVRAGSRAGTRVTGGRIAVQVDGCNYYVHRLAFLYMEGKFPPSVVDHINRDPSDNRWANLRHAVPRQNAWNRRPVTGSVSQYKGVTHNRTRKKWVAQIAQKIDGVFTCRYLGCFENEADAARAYDRAAREIQGEFFRPNFPEDGDD